MQNRWSHLFCISPFSVILIVIFYFAGQIENKSYFLPNQAVQTRENSIKNKSCTSQQKVDTFFIFYTLKTEHSTPYIVLVSNSLMSMQVFLH